MVVAEGQRQDKGDGIIPCQTQRLLPSCQLSPQSLWSFIKAQEAWKSEVTDLN